MKKIMIMVVVAMAAIAVNAANFKWNASKIPSVDYSGYYTGTATLYAMIDGAKTQVAEASVANGTIAIASTAFSDDRFVASTSYDFFFEVFDAESGKTLTSVTKSVVAQKSSTASILFGSQANQTWSIPEPTSALLLVLGMAGLALRRRQA